MNIPLKSTSLGSDTIEVHAWYRTWQVHLFNLLKPVMILHLPQNRLDQLVPKGPVQGSVLEDRFLF